MYVRRGLQTYDLAHTTSRAFIPATNGTFYGTGAFANSVNSISYLI